MVEPDAVKTFFGAGRPTQLLLLASIALAITANFLILTSVKLLGAAPASVIEISYPFFVVLFTVLLYGARMSVQFIAGAALVFLGSALIMKAV